MEATSNTEANGITKNVVQTKKKKKKSYKSCLYDIMKPTENTEEKDKKKK